MGWQTSAPSGITWGSWAKTDGIKLNYLWFWIRARIGRGANNTLAAQVQFWANRFDYNTSGAIVNGKAEISVNGGSWSGSSSYAGGPFSFSTDTTYKTIYWTGTANKGVSVKIRGYTPSTYTNSLSWSAPDYTTTYTVSYNANGGSGAPGNQTKIYATALTLSTTKPTRTGYTFSKWNTKSDGTGTSYASGASYTGNAALTLYAIWTPNTYIVTFKANGGAGEDTTQIKTYGADIVLDPNPFSRDKYSFTGWNTKADGTGTAYADEATYASNAALTLYAQWIKNNIPVFVNDNDIIRQVEKAYINDGGTIRECAVYLNDNGTIKEIT